MNQTITIGLTQREEVALVWDDLHNREQVEKMPSLVRRTKLWSYYCAPAGDWLRLARYADGQADHYLDGGMSCDADEARHIRADGHRCLKVAARIRAAVEAAAK